MTQSTVTVWALIALWFVFITVRGELPAYLGVFVGSAQAGSGSVSSGTGGQTLTGLGSAATLGTTLANTISTSPFYVPGSDIPVAVNPVTSFTL